MDNFALLAIWIDMSIQISGTLKFWYACDRKIAHVTSCDRSNLEDNIILVFPYIQMLIKPEKAVNIDVTFFLYCQDTMVSADQSI